MRAPLISALSLGFALAPLACGEKQSEPLAKVATVPTAPQTTTAAREPAAPEPTAPEPTVCESAPLWRFERIELPPEFAPSLPAGVEKLFFAPGMFKPAEADYWSYVFSLTFEAANAPADAAALEVLFERYYAGLIGAVGKGKGLSLGEPVAKVSVTANGGGFDAVVETFDTFTTGEPIRVALSVVISDDRKCINVAASPADKSAPIWTTLAAARQCVACD